MSRHAHPQVNDLGNQSVNGSGNGIAAVVSLPPRPDPDAAPVRTPGRVGKVARIERAVYSVKEVAELLDISTGTAYAWVRSGQLPARKLGAKWVIPKRAFNEWLDNLPQASPEEFWDAVDGALNDQERRTGTEHGNNPHGPRGGQNRGGR